MLLAPGNALAISAISVARWPGPVTPPPPNNCRLVHGITNAAARKLRRAAGARMWPREIAGCGRAVHYCVQLLFGPGHGVHLFLATTRRSPPWLLFPECDRSMSFHITTVPGSMPAVITSGDYRPYNRGSIDSTLRAHVAGNTRSENMLSCAAWRAKQNHSNY